MMSSVQKLTLVMVLSLFGFQAMAAMPKWLQDMQGQQQKKASTRWTIEDWLSQKQKVRWMDYWLAMNTAPVNFEASLGGAQCKYEVESSTAPGVTQEQEIKKGALSLYYRILGLSAEFDDSDEEFTTTSYMFNFRLIGPTLQSTQLTLHYGVSQVDSDLAGSQMDNQFAAMTLTLYIFHFFGLEGHYRSYFTATNDADIDSEGIRLSYGAFLEFGMLRLYGNLVHDTWTLTPPSSAKYDVERDGVEAGVQFYF